MPMMTDKPSLEILDDAQQNFLNAETAYAEATDQRAEVMVRLLDAGVRQSAIAERLGISRSRVQQITAARRSASNAADAEQPF